MSLDGWMSNTSYLGGSSSSGGLWDSITSSASSIFGGIGGAANSLGNWAKDNPAGANILGASIMAGGAYLTERQKEKAAAKLSKDEFDRQSAQYDRLHQVNDLNFNVSTDAGSVNGNAPLTSNGLLTQMQQTPVDYTKKLQGV